MTRAFRYTSSRTGKKSDVQKEFDKFVGRKILFMLALVILAVFLVGVSVTFGPLEITVLEVYETIIQRVLSTDLGMNKLTELVIWNIRLPRIMWGLVAGFGLGVAGCIMQAVLRNPLASPFTLGISAGANFGVSLAIVLNFAVFGGMYAVIGNAFLFAFLTSMIIIGISAIKGGTVELLILAGIALNYVFRAASDLFQYFATTEQKEATQAFGQGDLGTFGWSELFLVSLIILVCMVLVAPKLKDLNIMTAGDVTAKSLGIDAGHLRMFVMIIASFLVASVVAFVGPIGFVGLVAPHMSRMIIGSDHRFQLPASGLLGAIILVSSDILGMNIIPPIIIPVGIMTSILGVPFFFYLIMTRRREYW